MGDKVLVDVDLLEVAQNIARESLRGWFLTERVERENCALAIDQVLMQHDYNRAMKIAYDQGDLNAYNALKRDKTIRLKPGYTLAVEECNGRNS